MLNRSMLQNICRNALAEDVGSGDATTLAVVPPELEISAEMVTRQDCVCAGLPVAECVFKQLDPACVFEPLVQDGDRCGKGCVLARITGKAQAILTAERNALNFLQRLCGIATVTRRYVDAIAQGSKTKVLDTRKTTPGWRMLEKYAVKMGGGTNHRFGLYDRIMIKDNHRELAKLLGPDSIQRAVAACRAKYPKLEVEVEADTLEEVRAAIDAGAEYVLLDNMDNETVQKAIQLAAGRTKLEASGGITLERITRLSELGVDFISVGALTHSAPSVDIGLDLPELEHIP